MQVGLAKTIWTTCVTWRSHAASQEAEAGGWLNDFPFDRLDGLSNRRYLGRWEDASIQPDLAGPAADADRAENLRVSSRVAAQRKGRRGGHRVVVIGVAGRIVKRLVRSPRRIAEDQIGGGRERPVIKQIALDQLQVNGVRGDVELRDLEGVGVEFEAHNSDGRPREFDGNPQTAAATADLRDHGWASMLCREAIDARAHGIDEQ